MSEIPPGYQPFYAKIYQINNSLDNLTEYYSDIFSDATNINTNLSGLITDYSDMLKRFETSIEKQKNLGYNQPPLSDVKYETINSKYTTLKEWNESLLSKIDIINNKLGDLAGIVKNVDVKADEYIDFFRKVPELNTGFGNMDIGGKKPKKHCKKTKKNLRSRRFRKRKSAKSKKHNKKYIGGDYEYNWLVFSDLNDEDKDNVCSICTGKFSDTQEQVLYKTDCNHIFHNNCLVDVCLHKYNDFQEHNLFALCPICRAELDAGTSFQCLYITGFKENKLHNKTIQKDCSPKAKKIYYAQDGDDYDDDDDENI